MANDPLMSQDEIERLLSQTKDVTAPTPSTAPTLPPIDESLTSQGDVEKLLSASMPAAPPRAAAVPAKEPPPSAAADEGAISQQDIEFLLDQAERALQSVNSNSHGDLPVGVSSFRLDEFHGSPATTESATIDLIRDVELDLKIELGRTNMYLEDVLKLRKGAVVPLDKLAGDPVDIYVNGRLIARGEVLVLNDTFCVRVAELIAGANVF